jgi:hypothetical protein
MLVLFNNISGEVSVIYFKKTFSYNKNPDAILNWSPNFINFLPILFLSYKNILSYCIEQIFEIAIWAKRPTALDGPHQYKGTWAYSAGGQRPHTSPPKA